MTDSLPPRVVVLGGTGFIGRHVSEEFASVGVEVACFGSRDFDLAEPSSAQALSRVVGPRDLIFFGATIAPRLGRDRATMLRNIAMGDTVCRVLERSPCGGLVYMSTDNVYPPDVERLHERVRLDPVDLYGLGHLVRERLLGEAAASAGVPSLVLRTGPVYGPGDPNDSYGPDRFLRTAWRDGVIAIFGRGEEVRHHLFVADLARAVKELVARGVTGVVHVAPTLGTSFRQLAELVRDLVGPHVRIEEKLRSAPVRHRVHVPEKLGSLLPGFSCTPLEAGLARTLAAMREAARA